MKEKTKPTYHSPLSRGSEISSNADEMNTDVRQCVASMRKGGIILYPTDTIWGIGCDATNSEAVKKIYKLKERTDTKAMIILVDSVEMLERYVAEIPEVAYQLIEAAVTPMTVVYDKGIGLAPELLASDGSIGIRVTTDPFCKALCRTLGRPIVSTSANVSGAPAARFYSEISERILSGVDYISQWRRSDTTASSPSSVIKLSSGGVIRILRS